MDQTRLRVTAERTFPSSARNTSLRVLPGRRNSRGHVCHPHEPIGWRKRLTARDSLPVKQPRRVAGGRGRDLSRTELRRQINMAGSARRGPTMRRALRSRHLHVRSGRVPHPAGAPASLSSRIAPRPGSPGSVRYGASATGVQQPRRQASAEMTPWTCIAGRALCQAVELLLRTPFESARPTSRRPAWLAWSASTGATWNCRGATIAPIALDAVGASVSYAFGNAAESADERSIAVEARCGCLSLGPGRRVPGGRRDPGRLFDVPELTSLAAAPRAVARENVMPHPISLECRSSFEPSRSRDVRSSRLVHPQRSRRGRRQGRPHRVHPGRPRHAGAIETCPNGRACSSGVIPAAVEAPPWR